MLTLIALQYYPFCKANRRINLTVTKPLHTALITNRPAPFQRPARHLYVLRKAVLLSHSKQFLFVHIAKTGGTSVRAALSRYRWGHRYALAQFICNKMSQFTDHKIASRFPRHSRIIAAKEMLPETYFNQLFKFAVVRNPWDLQVSSFHHIKRERPAVMQGYNDFGHI